jgi:hypothetical protein
MKSLKKKADQTLILIRKNGNHSKTSWICDYFEESDKILNEGIELNDITI